MRRNLMIYADTTGELSAVEFVDRRHRLFAGIARLFPGQVQLGDGFLVLRDGSDSDVETLRHVANVTGIGFEAVADTKYTSSELRCARFVRLAVEGEPVDEDAQGRQLNQFPRNLCEKCGFPDEASLPAPYQVTMLLDSEPAGDYWGEGTPTPDCEIYAANFGILVVTNRVKNLLDRIVPDSFVSAPAHREDYSDGERRFWAVRPVVTWGTEMGRAAIAECASCKRAIEARLSGDVVAEIKDDRLRLMAEELPNAEIVCTMGWFGDRSRSNAGIFRDVLVSGRLYAVLSRNNVRGLCKPTEPVWLDGELPSFPKVGVDAWIASNL